ncbi:uncharacterized protein [Manis javanica]|uniref:uncharacterized protein n=1 Tax=Manis javanica TaxID=9974 RepID=UPI001879EC27|nr:uncharacterized protein LOC108400765 [Manis javanica]
MKHSPGQELGPPRHPADSEQQGRSLTDSPIWAPVPLLSQDLGFDKSRQNMKIQSKLTGHMSKEATRMKVNKSTSSCRLQRLQRTSRNEQTVRTGWLLAFSIPRACKAAVEMNEHTNDQILTQRTNSFWCSINILFFSGEEKRPPGISLKPLPYSRPGAETLRWQRPSFWPCSSVSTAHGTAEQDRRDTGLSDLTMSHSTRSGHLPPFGL